MRLDEGQDDLKSMERLKKVREFFPALAEDLTKGKDHPLYLEAVVYATEQVNTAQNLETATAFVDTFAERLEIITDFLENLNSTTTIGAKK